MMILGRYLSDRIFILKEYNRLIKNELIPDE